MSFKSDLAAISEGFCPEHLVPLGEEGWCPGCGAWRSAGWDEDPDIGCPQIVTQYPPPGSDVFRRYIRPVP